MRAIGNENASRVFPPDSNISLSPDAMPVSIRLPGYVDLDAHLGRLPVVVAARWGRITDIWNPWQQASLDHYPEGRETWVANSSLLMWWVFLALGIAGVFVLRARRVPVYPLLALPVTVLTAITLTFATTRYRATMETVVCVLAATAVVSFVDALRAGGSTQIVDLTTSEPALGAPAPTA